MPNLNNCYNNNKNQIMQQNDHSHKSTHSLMQPAFIVINKNAVYFWNVATVIISIHLYN